MTFSAEAENYNYPKEGGKRRDGEGSGLSLLCQGGFRDMALMGFVQWLSQPLRDGGKRILTGPDSSTSLSLRLPFNTPAH